MAHFKNWLICIALGLLCTLLAGGVMVGIEYGLPIARNLRAASDSLPETLSLIRTDAKISTDTSANLYGAIDDFDKLIWKFDDTTDATTGLINATNAKVPALLENTNQAMVSTKTAVDTLNVQIAQIGNSATKTLDSVPPAVNGLTELTADARRIVNDPDTQGTLDNVNLVTGNMAQATGDFAKKEHDLFFPPPCTKFCGLRRAYQIGKGVMSLAEPAYYTKGLF